MKIVVSPEMYYLFLILYLQSKSFWAKCFTFSAKKKQKNKIICDIPMA